MRILGVVVLAISMLGCLSFAAAPVGTIASSTPFQLRGSSVPVAGVPYWPLVAGDEISTDAGPAMLRLSDGIEITLDRSSRAKIDNDGGQLVFRLESGSMQYKVPRSATIRIVNRNSPVPVQPGVIGTVSTKPGPIHYVLRPPPPPPPPGPISAR